MSEPIEFRNDSQYDIPMTTLDVVDTTFPVTYRHMDDDSVCTTPDLCKLVGRDWWVSAWQNWHPDNLGE